jgi:hypothetical protein
VSAFVNSFQIFYSEHQRDGDEEDRICTICCAEIPYYAQVIEQHLMYITDPIEDSWFADMAVLFCTPCFDRLLNSEKNTFKKED